MSDTARMPDTQARSVKGDTCIEQPATKRVKIGGATGYAPSVTVGAASALNAETGMTVRL